MRPLMVPDPHCASCNGTFVEKMENPADDPREFQVADGGQWDDGALPAGMDTFFAGLQRVLSGPAPPMRSSTVPVTNTRSTSPQARRSTTDGYRRAASPEHLDTGHSNRSGFTVRIERSSAPGGRNRTFVYGTNPATSGADEVPRLSQFAPRNADGPSEDRANITGPMLAQYLLALMGPGRAGDPFSDLIGGMFGPPGMPPGGAESGRWGDYVFNQEALDQIISQIMENSNAHQPVPATEDALEKLHKEVLEEGSPLLDKDCAVCKEQFALHTEDPDDQVIISLPCNHPFHENCILPWLKNSGTCPVCRYQLVAQPDPHSTGSDQPPQGPNRSGSSSSARSGAIGSDAGGVLQNVLGFFAAHGPQGSSSSSASAGNSARRSGTAPSSSTSPPASGSGGSSSSAAAGSRSSRPETEDHFNVPGSWGEDVD
uniref:RING-type domain-containing protein n=1 Tax=Trametes gibbosa TaxID=160864 RepID=A0A6G6FQD9_9APHY|nr:hypothetical protein [Trametes gibbosa]